MNTYTVLYYILTLKGLEMKQLNNVCANSVSHAKRLVSAWPMFYSIHEISKTN